MQGGSRQIRERSRGRLGIAADEVSRALFRAVHRGRPEGRFRNHVVGRQKSAHNRGETSRVSAAEIFRCDRLRNVRL